MRKLSDRLFRDAPPEIHRLFALPGASWSEAEVWQLYSWLRLGHSSAALRHFVETRVALERVEDVFPQFLEEIAAQREELVKRYQPKGSRPPHAVFAVLFLALLRNHLRKRRRTSQALARRTSHALARQLDDSLLDLHIRQLFSFGAVGAIAGFFVADLIAPVLRRGELTRDAGDLKKRSPAGRRGMSDASPLGGPLASEPIPDKWPEPERVAGNAGKEDEGDWVEATVFGPPAIRKGENALIQVFVHAPQLLPKARAAATAFDKDARQLGGHALGAPIPVGTRLTFVLAAPGLRVRHRTQSIVWRGRMTAASFAVRMSAGFKNDIVVGTVSVAAHGVPIGKLNFKIRAAANTIDYTHNTAISNAARRYTKAFVSYASSDRNEVLKRVQMLRLFRIKYFQDLLDLEPGQRWANALYRHIDNCDLFLLFWSKAARDSKLLGRKKGLEPSRPCGRQPLKLVAMAR